MSTPERDHIEVAILAAHAVVLIGLRQMFTGHGHLRIVAEGSTVDEGVAMMKNGPHVLIVDPDSDEITLDSLKDLAHAGSGRVVVFTGTSDARLNRQAFELGAVGLVLKIQPKETLIRAIERVHAGEIWLDRVQTANLLRALLRPNNPEDGKIQSLTKREREVIVLVGQGLKNALIGQRLFISEATVRNHLTSILSKLQLANRFELAVYSFRNGLIEQGLGEDLEAGQPSGTDGALVARGQGRP